MYEPDTAYAPIGDRRIAYQVYGDGPTDLLLSAGYASIDAELTHPEIALFNRRLAEVARLIRFDALGSGASDPLPDDGAEPIDRQIGEVLAVLDAAGSERAVVMGADNGSAAILALAARHPDRVEGVVIMHGAARWLAADDYPDGFPLEEFEAYEKVFADMDAESVLRMAVPSRAGDDDFLRWGRKWLRQMTSPAVMRSVIREAATIDVRSELPAIVAPTLVVHRTGFEGTPVALSRYVADHVPNSRFVEIPGSDGPPWFDHPEAVLAALREFLAGIGVTAAAPSRSQRLMATVLFTDLVGSTVRAQQVGDAEWRHLLQLHEDTSRQTVHSHGGRLVKTTGDGILATFDQPGNAIRCAVSLCRALGRVGLPIRAGLHTGEVELLGDDIGGVAVHIAARVMAAAGSGEVLVSRTVRDLTVGSDFTYADRGMHTLKGVEGEWQLLAVTT